jgi:glutaminase
MAILLEERLWDQSKDNVEQYANQTTLKTRLRELATLMMMMQNDQEPPQKRQKVSVRK